MDDEFYIFLLVMKKKNFYMLVTTICSYYKQGCGDQWHWEQKQQRGVEQEGQGKDQWKKEAGRGELLGRGVSVMLLHRNFIPEADVRVYHRLFSPPSAFTCCELGSLYHYLT